MATIHRFKDGNYLIMDYTKTNIRYEFGRIEMNNLITIDICDFHLHMSQHDTGNCLNVDIGEFEEFDSTIRNIILRGQLKSILPQLELIYELSKVFINKLLNLDIMCKNIHHRISTVPRKRRDITVRAVNPRGLYENRGPYSGFYILHVPETNEDISQEECEIAIREFLDELIIHKPSICMKSAMTLLRVNGA